MDSHEEDLERLDVLSSVPKLGGPIGRLIGWLDALFTLLAVLAMVGIIVSVSLQIVGRLFLPVSPTWTEELSRYLFIYMVALSSGVVLRKNRNVNVELFHALLGPRSRAAYQVLVCMLVGMFAAIVLPYAWEYAQIGTFQTSPTLKIPMLYIFFSTVFLFALVLFYSVIGAVEGVAAMLRTSSATESSTWK